MHTMKYNSQIFLQYLKFCASSDPCEKFGAFCTGLDGRIWVAEVIVKKKINISNSVGSSPRDEQFSFRAGPIAKVQFQSTHF